MEQPNFEGGIVQPEGDQTNETGGIMEMEPTSGITEAKPESQEVSMRSPQEQKLDPEKKETSKKLATVMHALERAARVMSRLSYDLSSEEREFASRIITKGDNLTDEEARIVKESADLINSAMMKIMKVRGKYR